MRKTALLFALLLLPAGFAATVDTSDWYFQTVDIGAFDNTFEVEATNEGSDSLAVVASPGSNSQGVWRLWKTIPHPDADIFKIMFKINPEAFDEDKQPHFILFIYKGTSIDDIRGKTLISYRDLKPCHIHQECNEVTPDITGIYCVTEQSQQNWKFNGYAYGCTASQGCLNDYGMSTDPLEEGDWNSISFNAECSADNLTLVIMAQDFSGTNSFTWSIKNVEIEATTTVKHPFLKIYDYDEGEYVEAPAFCGDGIADPGETCDSCPEDAGICDGEDCVEASECESGFCVHEVCRPSDPYCSDSFCDGGESTVNCPADCGAIVGSDCETDGECRTEHCVHGTCRRNATYCGDGFCDEEPGESYLDCLNDCRAPPQLINGTVYGIYDVYDYFDLDNQTEVTGEAADVLYQNGSFVPQGNSQVSRVAGGNVDSVDCSQQIYAETPLSITQGDLICIITGEGRYAAVHVTGTTNESVTADVRYYANQTAVAPTATIFGMDANTFYLIVIVLVFLILGIVAALVVGVTVVYPKFKKRAKYKEKVKKEEEGVAKADRAKELEKERLYSLEKLLSEK